jgi:hypothetical protein
MACHALATRRPHPIENKKPSEPQEPREQEQQPSVQDATHDLLLSSEQTGERLNLPVASFPRALKRNASRRFDTSVQEHGISLATLKIEI